MLIMQGKEFLAALGCLRLGASGMDFQEIIEAMLQNWETQKPAFPQPENRQLQNCAAPAMAWSRETFTTQWNSSADSSLSPPQTHDLRGDAKIRISPCTQLPLAAAAASLVLYWGIPLAPIQHSEAPLQRA